MIVKYIGENTENKSWLVPGKDYYVLEIIINSAPTLQFRLISEDLRTPIIIQSNLFEIVDNKIPDNWYLNKLETYVEILPKSIFLYKGSFWEDYFDSTPEIESRCRDIVEKQISEIQKFHNSAI